MTTTTSGVAHTDISAITAAAIVAPLEPLALPTTRRRQRVASWVFGLDVVVGTTLAAVAAMAATPGAAARAGLVAGWPVAVALAGGYARLGDDPRRFPGRALASAALGTATAMWTVAALTTRVPTASSVHLLALTSLVLTAAALLGSIACRLLVAVLAPRRALSTVLIGAPAQVRELLREGDRAGGRSFEAVAVCLPATAAGDLTVFEGEVSGDASAWPVPVWAGLDAGILDAVRVHRAEAVVVAPGPDIGQAEVRRWAAWLQHENVRLLVSPGLRDVAPGRLATTTWGGSRLLDVAPAPLGGPSRLVKALVDRIVGSLLLVLLAPVLGVLALLIRRESPGPAFYRQTRVGRDGHAFTVYKLRSMCVDADLVRERLHAENESDQGGVLFKIRQDPRVTRLGSFLRRSSLDELPQLLNVVRGEMSLVGPRPALPDEVRAYPPDVRRRLDVKPGLTGLWQVSGRSDLSWDDTVRLDLQYVDNWSWPLDLRIAVLTVRAVLSRRGAY
jgi:exopolysaccharide biosynthesis polyprenyl glycosylphosphotransferase